jgi:hypothetical protein
MATIRVGPVRFRAASSARIIAAVLNRACIAGQQKVVGEESAVGLGVIDGLRGITRLTRGTPIGGPLGGFPEGKERADHQKQLAMRALDVVLCAPMQIL